MKTICLRRLFALAIGFMLAAPADTETKAAITVTLDGPQTLTIGQSATYNLFGSSDSNDVVDGFGIVLNIAGGPGLGLSATQSDTFLTDTDYVFFGRSGSVAMGLSATAPVGDSLSIADFSDDQSATPNPGASDPFTFGNEPRLIARFSVDAVAPGNFSLSLDPTTSFNDPDFNPISFNATPLHVTAVPEPSVAFVTVMATGCIGLRRWRTKRRTNRVDQTI